MIVKIVEKRDLILRINFVNFSSSRVISDERPKVAIVSGSSLVIGTLRALYNFLWKYCIFSSDVNACEAPPTNVSTSVERSPPRRGNQKSSVIVIILRASV